MVTDRLGNSCIMLQNCYEEERKVEEKERPEETKYLLLAQQKHIHTLLLKHFGYLLIYLELSEKNPQVFNNTYLMVSIHMFIQKRLCVKALAMQSNSPRPQASRSWWATSHSRLIKMTAGSLLARFFALEGKRTSQQQFQEFQQCAEHIPLGLFHICRCVLGCNTYISILAKSWLGHEPQFCTLAHGQDKVTPPLVLMTVVTEAPGQVSDVDSIKAYF